MRACMPDQYQSLSYWCNQVLTALTTSSSDSNFLLQTESFMGLERWYLKVQSHPACCVMASRSLTLVWGLALSCQSNISRWFLSGLTLETLPHFVQRVDIRIWVKCHSSLHHIKENHSRTVLEHHVHHVSGWWRASRSCTFPTSQSLTLFA